jgi:hypothetical protein
VAAEDRRNRNEQIKEVPDPLDLRPRVDHHAREGLAFGHRVRERVPAGGTGAVVRGLVAGCLAEREAGGSLRAWLRRQPPGTLAGPSRPVGRAGSGEPRRGAPVDRTQNLAGVAGGA